MEIALRQNARAAGGDAQQVGDARPVDGEEGVEHGGDEDRAAIVRLGRDRVQLGIGYLRLPLARHRIDAADGVAQRSAAADRLAELVRELAQQVLARQVAARLGDLVAQGLRLREVLEQGDDVGERLVERQHVGVARLREVAVQAVEQRVRGLVRDDVVRQAGEHQAARQVLAPDRDSTAGK